MEYVYIAPTPDRSVPPSRVTKKSDIEIVLNCHPQQFLGHLSFNYSSLGCYNPSPTYLQVSWFRDIIVDVLWWSIRSYNFPFFL